MDSYTIPPDADNYEEVRNMLKTQGSNKAADLGNQMFYETYDMMNTSPHCNNRCRSSSSCD